MARILLSGFRIALTGRHAWRLAISFLVLAIGVATFLVHLQPMLIGSGMSAKSAAYIASVVALSLIVERLITGAMESRLPRKSSSRWNPYL